MAASVACALLALVLMALDSSKLVHHYAYLGMGNDWPSVIRGLTTVAVAAAIGAVLPTRQHLPGALVVWVLAILITIPAIVVTPRDDPAANMASLVPLIGLVVLIVVCRVRVNLNVPPGPGNRNSFLVVLAGLAIIATGLVAVSYGLRPSFATLTSMYSVRSEFEVRSAAAGPIAAYASGWLVNLLGPTLIGLGVLWRRKVAVALGCSCLLIHYLAVPSKLVVLLPLLSAVVALALRAGRGLPGPASVALGVTALALITWAVFPEPGNVGFSILTFRTLFIPVFIGTMWVRFFSDNPKGNFAEQFPFFSNDYGDVALPKFMAQTFGSGQGSNNANLWADGFGNLGLTGVIIASIVLGLTLALANAVARRRDFRDGFIIFLGPAVSLLNNSAFTNLLTGGTILAILLIAMLPSATREDANGCSSSASLVGRNGKPARR